MTQPADDCIFCRIVAGEIPARRVFEDDQVLAFHDLQPRAPTHVLLIPKRHIVSAAELGTGDAEMLGRLFAAAADVAREAGVAQGGYRIVTNVGDAAGQSVGHLHFHLLGGRSLSWPPG
jgi:histidine triad (HIT) family protein